MNQKLFDVWDTADLETDDLSELDFLIKENPPFQFITPFTFEDREGIVLHINPDCEVGDIVLVFEFPFIEDPYLAFNADHEWIPVKDLPGLIWHVGDPEKDPPILDDYWAKSPTKGYYGIAVQEDNYALDYFGLEKTLPVRIGVYDSFNLARLNAELYEKERR